MTETQVDPAAMGVQVEPVVTPDVSLPVEQAQPAIPGSTTLSGELGDAAQQIQEAAAVQAEAEQPEGEADAEIPSPRDDEIAAAIAALKVNDKGELTTPDGKPIAPAITRELLNLIAGRHASVVVENQIASLHKDISSGKLTPEVAQKALDRWESMKPIVTEKAKQFDDKLAELQKSEDPIARALGVDMDIHLKAYEYRQEEEQIKTRKAIIEQGGVTEEQQKKMKADLKQAEDAHEYHMAHLNKLKLHRSEMRDAQGAEITDQVSGAAVDLISKLSGDKLTTEKIKQIKEKPIQQVEQVLNGVIGNKPQVEIFVKTLKDGGVLTEKEAKQMEDDLMNMPDNDTFKNIAKTGALIMMLLLWMGLKQGVGEMDGGGGQRH